MLTESVEPRARPAVHVSPLALLAVGGALLGIGLRVWLLLSPLGALDSDEAVVGFLTRGILHGTLVSFFPGQGYGGTQEEFLSAPLVDAFGLSAATIRTVPIVLWAVSAVLVWRIGLLLLDARRAVVAAVLFWVWPAYFLWKSTRAHGFYGSSLVLGLAVLLLVLRLERAARRRDLVLLGLALGCGLWSSPQVGVVALPALGWLVWRRPRLIRQLGLVLPAAGVAALPWLLTNLHHHWYSLHLGRNEGPWSNHAHNLVVSTLPEALGLRLSWSFRWIAGEAATLALYAVIVCGFLWLIARCRTRLVPLLLVVVVFPIFYFVSPYTWLETEPRYLSLAMPVFALLAAAPAVSAFRATAVLAVAIALSIGGIVELERGHVAAFRTEGGVPVPADIGPVLRTLRRHDLHYAFTSYWISWRLTFESHGEITGATVAFSHPRIRNGRVLPGDPLNGFGFDLQPYLRVAEHRNVADVFVLGGNVEPRLEPILVRASYRRIVTGGFAVWIPPRT